MQPRGAPRRNQGQLTNNGKISVEKSTTLCPTLREAMTGLQWVKVKHEVHSAMPELAAFLAEAGNAGSGIAREHTVTHVMLQIHQNTKWTTEGSAGSLPSDSQENQKWFSWQD